MVNEGDKVGAISRVEDGIIYFFGWGVYEGIHTPPDNIKFQGQQINAMPEPYNQAPRIRLKIGKIVWGSECYWGVEGIIREQIAGHKVLLVEPSVERRGPQKKGGDDLNQYAKL